MTNQPQLQPQTNGKRPDIFSIPATGYPVMDAIVNTVKLMRYKNIAVKAIWMKPSTYTSFISDFQKYSGRELLMNEPLELDGIDLELGEITQREKLRFELYHL